MRGASDMTSTAPKGKRVVRAELLAAYAPAVISNSMASPNVSNSLTIATFNSLFLTGTYFHNQNISLEGSYQRMSVDLYKDQSLTGGTTDQPMLSFRPQSLSARLQGRWSLGSGAWVPQMEARVGYLYKSFYTYYAASLTTFALSSSGAHHVIGGLGLRQPLPANQAIEVQGDLAKPLSSGPTQVTAGRLVQFQAWYSIEVQAPLKLGFGLRYASASYDFTDTAHEVEGLLEEGSVALFAALAWGL